jgi:hypothetical protein
MSRFIEVVKQYPGQQQVDLSVEIEVPGNWFGGSLAITEKLEKYKTQAVEYAEVREFPGPHKQSKKTKDPAILFICIADAQEDPNSLPFILGLAAPATAEPE